MKFFKHRLAVSCLQERSLLNARSKVVAGRSPPPTSARFTSGRTPASGHTTAPSPAAGARSPAPPTTRTTCGYTRVSLANPPRLDTKMERKSLSPYQPSCVSLQVRSRTCAPSLAARSASRNTRASTNTTWSTRRASRTTATTAAKPTSRSPRWPCTNAPPTTTRSPSKRSRRPTSSPLPVSAGLTSGRS